MGGSYSFTTAAVTGAPALSTPTNNALNQPLTGLTLNWSSSSGGPVTSYTVNVSTDATFATGTQGYSPGSDTSQALPALPTGPTGVAYYWEIGATGPGGTTWLAEWSFTTIPSPPAAPTLSTPTNNAINQAINLNLNWSSSSGAEVNYYTVQVSTDGTFATGVTVYNPELATTQALTGLSAATLYYWRVDATGTGGTGSWSPIYSFSTLTPWGPPTLSAPASGVLSQALSLTVSWIAVTGASSYEVQVSTDPAFGSTFLDQSNIASNSLNVSGLSNYTTYYWQVNSYDNTQTMNPDPSTWSGAWSFTTIIETPALSTPTSGSQNQPISLSLNWGSVAGASTYALQVSTASGFGSTVFSQSGLTAPSQAISALAASTTYYWEVNATGNGATTLWSSVGSFSTVAAPEVRRVRHRGMPRPTRR